MRLGRERPRKAQRREGYSDRDAASMRLGRERPRNAPPCSHARCARTLQ